jgi:hypothetical protein
VEHARRDQLGRGEHGHGEQPDGDADQRGDPGARADPPLRLRRRHRYAVGEDHRREQADHLRGEGGAVVEALGVGHADQHAGDDHADDAQVQPGPQVPVDLRRRLLGQTRADQAQVQQMVVPPRITSDRMCSTCQEANCGLMM